MEQLSDRAITIINGLHTERLDYQSEYIPLIDAANSLAAYEDTGLEPEEIERIVDAYGRGHTLRSESAERLEIIRKIKTDRLCELAQAEQDGRLVVLPCKVGDTVYRIYDDCDFPGVCHTKRICKGCEYRNLFIEEQEFCLSMLSQNGMIEHPYYLTHEEA